MIACLFCIASLIALGFGLVLGAAVFIANVVALALTATAIRVMGAAAAAADKARGCR